MPSRVHPQAAQQGRPVRVFIMVWRGLRHLRIVAGLLGAGSNQLTDVLREWNDVLQHSSLGRGQPSNENEGKDGDAPCVSRPAAVRRRKMA